MNGRDGTFQKYWTAPQENGGGAVKQAEDALKALREAKDKEGRRRASEALEQAVKKLREQLK